jgi:hypothetical protein
MAYEFRHRGDMWFGNVYDVYESNQWIGGVMQGAADPRWSAVTPSGHGAEPLPFESREEAAAWLGARGERIPRSRKWRYSPLSYAVLGPVREVEGSSLANTSSTVQSVSSGVLMGVGLAVIGIAYIMMGSGR